MTTLTTRRLLYNGIAKPYMYALAYMVFGVFLFSCLEQLHEEVLEDDDDVDESDDSVWEQTEDKIRNFLLKVLTPPNATTTLNTTESDEHSLVEAIRAIKQPWRLPGNVRKHGGTKEALLKFGVPRRWGWEKSFRFVEALLTSIGYGDVVPLSPAAKLLTIIYAAAGLPIFLNAISSTQETFNDIIDRFLIFYAKVSSTLTFTNAKLLTVAVVWLLYLHLGSLLFSAIFEHWPYETAFYFCFISLTTIGLGDYVPSTLTGVHTVDVDVDAVLDADSKRAAFNTIKPTLIIMLRHAYTFIGLSITALWFDVLKNYWKGQMTLPQFLLQQQQQEQQSSSFTSTAEEEETNGKINQIRQKSSHQQHDDFTINDDFTTKNRAGPDTNYGGPEVFIPKHLLARYKNIDTLRATTFSNDDSALSPSSSPSSPTGVRDSRSPSPFRASIIEKVVVRH